MIPIFFDKSVQAYRVPPGFRFSGVEPEMVDPGDVCSPAVHDLLSTARSLLQDTEAFLVRLRTLCDELEATRPAPMPKQAPPVREDRDSNQLDPSSKTRHRSVSPSRRRRP